jgi:hypothetical protein
MQDTGYREYFAVILFIMEAYFKPDKFKINYREPYTNGKRKNDGFWFLFADRYYDEPMDSLVSLSSQ